LLQLSFLDGDRLRILVQAFGVFRLREIGDDSSPVGVAPPLVLKDIR
jgi:hypothetical protein